MQARALLDQLEKELQNGLIGVLNHVHHPHIARVILLDMQSALGVKRFRVSRARTSRVSMEMPACHHVIKPPKSVASQLLCLRRPIDCVPIPAIM